MGIFATNETGMLCYSDDCDHLGSLEPGIQMKVIISGPVSDLSMF